MSSCNPNDVQALYTRYADLISDQRWDEWLTLFTEDATYKVTTRDNELRGLPAGILYCSNRMMLADRIDAARYANIYRRHVNRLLLGLPSVASVASGDGQISASCSFCVVQTEDAGIPFVFAAGKYVDCLAVTDSGLQFRSKLVVLDNSRITTSMPVPI